MNKLCSSNFQISETLQRLRPVRQSVLPLGHHRAGLLRPQVPRLKQLNAVARAGQGNQEAVHRKRSLLPFQLKMFPLPILPNLLKLKTHASKDLLNQEPMP